MAWHAALRPPLRGLAWALRCVRPRSGSMALLTFLNLWLFTAAHRRRKHARFLAFCRGLNDLDEDTLSRMLGHLPLWIKDGDYESVRWLNHGIHRMWPHFNKMICSLLKRELEPLINAAMPETVSKVSFHTLNLGSMPPLICGVRRVSNHHGDFGLELDIKWGGNPKVGLVLASRKQKGAWHPGMLFNKLMESMMYVTLDTVIVEGKLRLFFAPLVNNIVVGGMRFQLPQKPLIDFNISSYGLNLMSLPAVSTLLRHTVQDTALGILTWPKDLHVRWCSEEAEAQAWGHEGSMPGGVLQIELLECHLAPRPFSGSGGDWNPFLVMLSRDEDKPGQTGLSRSSTVQRATKFLVHHNWAVAIQPSQTLRIMVLHDTDVTDIEADLPLAVIDISMKEVLEAVSAHREAAASADHPEPADARPQGLPSARSAPAVADHAADCEPDVFDEHAASTHSAPPDRAVRTASAPEDLPAITPRRRSMAFELEPASASDSTHPQEREGGSAAGRTSKRPANKHKESKEAKPGFEWWNPMTWTAGHKAAPQESPTQATDSSQKGAQPHPGSVPPRARRRQASASASASGIISYQLPDDGALPCDTPLSPLFGSNGAWLRLLPLKAAHLHLGGEVVLHTMRDSLQALQDFPNMLGIPNMIVDGPKMHTKKAKGLGETAGRKMMAKMGKGKALKGHRRASMSDLRAAAAAMTPLDGAEGGAGRGREERAAREWAVYHEDMVRQGQTTEVVASLVQALSPAKAADCAAAQATVQRPSPSSEGADWTYGNEPGLLKLKLTFYPSRPGKWDADNSPSPFGMIMVNVSVLHFSNTVLRNPVAMLRVDGQLCWTESARAKNGQVTWDEEMTFVLGSDVAANKRLEVLIVENDETIRRFLPLQASLKHAEVKAGVNISLHSTIVYESGRSKWPIYLVDKQPGADTRHTNSFTNIKCGEIHMQMKWLRTAKPAQ